MNIFNRMLAKLFGILRGNASVLPFSPYVTAGRSNDFVSQLCVKKNLLNGTRYHYKGLHEYDELWDFTFSLSSPDRDPSGIKNDDELTSVVIGRTEDFDTLALSADGDVLIRLDGVDKDWYKLCSFVELVEQMTPADTK